MITESYNEGTLNDDDIEYLGTYLHNILRESRRMEGSRVAATLRGGAKVRIRRDAALRPRYILGIEATVVKVNQTTATITLGEVRHGGRFFTGQEIRCPLEALELVEAS